MRYFLLLSLCASLFIFCKTKPEPKTEFQGRPKIEQADDPKQFEPMKDVALNADRIAGNYRITELMGEPISAELGANISINRGLDKVMGFSSCNKYEANIKFTGMQVKISGLGATERGCSEEKMQTEEALYSAFRKAHSYRLAGENQLLFVAFDRSPLLLCIKKSGK